MRFFTLLCLATLVTSFPRDSLAFDAKSTFESEIAPLLARRCLECHNPRETKGELDLSSHSSLLRGGDEGPAIVPGKPGASLLLERVRAGEMPPKKKGVPQPLPADEVATLEKWIAAGAPWPKGRELSAFEATTSTRAGLDWWSLQPITSPEAPTASLSQPSRARARNPIDAFVLAELEREMMTMAPEADARTLVRRLYFDVVGLPPPPEEIDRFAADPSDEAWSALVDQLLASPHYGERWARYWLDVVRFAETNGYERDATKPAAWKYRDWVIDALNRDKPFDRFVLEQLAGDELDNRSEETVTATGMLRLGTWNDEPNDPFEYKFTRLEDLVHSTSTAFLGMTVKCARCHDHKFDPIPQTDYYRLASAFWAGPIRPGTGGGQGGPKPEQLGFDVLGWTDVSREAPDFHLLHKGDSHKPRQVIAPATLSFVPKLERRLAEPKAKSKTTGRRRQIAEWITDRRHPLPARVFMNRVWMHHFGMGIVRTPNNFGFTGDKPSHPGLLDWLASEFRSGGWKLKRIHRLILTSSTYRMSSVHPEQAKYSLRDSANRNLWRANRRRLDAEALRDAMLATAGVLNTKAGGPSFYPRISPEALEGLSRKGASWGGSPEDERKRRSVYIFSKRSLIVPMMTAFDFCDTTQPCPKRDVTTVAPQALALLNNHFVHSRSDDFRKRVLADVTAKASLETIVDRAWRLAFGRAPASDERRLAVEHVAAQEALFRAKNNHAEEPKQEPEDGRPTATIPERGLVLWLRSDRGVKQDENGRVVSWADGSNGKHHAAQEDAKARPVFVESALGGKKRPVIRFDGRTSFLHLAGRVVSERQFTILALASDRGMDRGHREIISNWNGAAGNYGTSIFLGLTGDSTVRFTDVFASAGSVAAREKHFVLTSIAAATDAVVYQNRRLIARKRSPLAERRLDTAWVVGTQGNYGKEFWNGDIAELIVWGRALEPNELRRVWAAIEERYGLPLGDPSEVPELASGGGVPLPRDARTFALNSLCHALLNANEFIYVD